MAAADRAGAAYLQFRQDEAFSLGTRDAAVDAVQAPVHPDLQLIGRLSTHPFSQFIDRRCPPSAIFSEDFKQRTRPLQPPSVRVTAGVIGCSIWHGVPPPATSAAYASRAQHSQPKIPVRDSIGVV
jgi:hypothetical protein